MITINGRSFYEVPTSCGTCPFLFVPGRDAPSFFPSSSSTNPLCNCTLFDEWHRVCTSPPRRCVKLFTAAFKFPEYSTLVITKKDQEEMMEKNEPDEIEPLDQDDL